MNTSNPYLRSLVLGAIWSVAIVLKSAARNQGGWSSLSSSYWVGIGFSWIITGLLVGLTCSRFSPLRSWWGVSLGTVAVWFGVMGLFMLLLPTAISSSPKQKFVSTDEMMKHFASEAAQWVKQDKGIDLDYSFNSIKLIEEQLGHLSKTVDKANPQKGMRGQAMGYGAYIGEVFKRQNGGSWMVDHPTGGERSYSLITKSNAVIFPVIWSWNRIINGEEDNVYHKTLAFAGQEAASTNVIQTR